MSTSEVATRRPAITVEFPGHHSEASIFALLSTVNKLAGTSNITLAANAEGPPHEPSHSPGNQLSISTRTCTAHQGSRPLPLSRREFDLLLFLVSHPNTVFTRNQLLKYVWHSDNGSLGPRTVDVHVRRLRSKLGTHARWVITVRGVGYRLDANSEIVITDA